MLEIATRCQAVRELGEDRVLAVAVEDQAWLAVADGVGGSHGGAQAADLLIEQVAGRRGDHDLCAVLRDADRAIAESVDAGFTTAVLVSVTGNLVWGASVGDSRAWLVQGDRVLDLSDSQRKNPKLGAGNAVPFAFGPELCEGTLLLATDGLFNYVPQKDIVSALREPELSSSADSLVELARLPGGTFQDDVALVVCRHVL